jgi:predicted O-methyltransferase YrrM
MQSNDEKNQILYLTYLTRDVQGACAEVGVYQGASAEVISHCKRNKKLYLYDTFDGFKDVGEHDKVDLQSIFSFSGVEDHLRNLNLPNVEIVKGYFPDTAIEDRFSFVHLDADTYVSTLKALEWFYPRMNCGGVVLLHDYTNPNVSVKKALDSFLSGKGENLVVCQTSQAYFIKA